MDETLNKGIALQKLTKKLDILKTLRSEQDPNYELRVLSDYEAFSIDMDITLETLNSMIKKYGKIRKSLLKEFKKEVKLLK
jgi:hypothetical protein